MHQVTDPIRLGNVTVILIYLWLASEVAGVAAALGTIMVLGGFGGPIAAQSQLELADTFTGVSAVATLIVFVAAGTAVLRWIYMTNRNGHAFGDGLGITPGWSVGWFFVPFLNLYKPFEGVSETWRATVARDDGGTVPVPPLLRWWWGLWIATSIWGNIVFRLGMRAETPEQLIMANWAMATSLLIDVPLVLVLTRMIKQLSAMQARRLADMAGRDATGDATT